MSLTKEQLLDYYRKMRNIREFEETIHRENTTGEIPGFLHLYCGEEANAVGVCAHLSDDDYIASNHRGHGHCVAKGSDPRLMVMELYGRAEGLCGGKGGSMHIADLDRGSLGANGIVGAGAPLATGAALTQKVKGRDNVSVCFFGDGASNEGYVFEAMNLAVILKLPVIFYCENNGVGEGTGVDYAVGADSIADRAAAFGMPAKKIDGTDFFSVYDAMEEVVAHCRAGNGPYFVEAETVRFYGHFEGDPQKYRLKEEIDNAKLHRDCLKKFRSRVIEEGLATTEEFDSIDSDLVAAYKGYVAEAKQAAWPRPEALTEDVYITY
ncbi:thiamine pyrophosphate-dependent dehydrogenase E1 component subunit alpha [Pseudomaricurvus alkylphenolicus]|uniref:thiamine pyrophosphate-dependent dehydrogenase E1 component subunit alpha n=1 Tax=Pseudomaricurvus alkylphenolicus TaxID=1306991 RepID=UPI001421BE69|nr:thiamine pyrophosphate-dependent dehydrogenase E1 component subunit alpha [Pseudomaricurvus alkylphenolicus]NIB41651.1 thiamine pyrophosphate-dependent dehydrogenase E1 component subunit alpha [Pseudomaricurvus alkylphenolicus]